MDDLLALDISGAGMRAQRLRMQVVSENLANMHTTGPDGPYQRKEAIFQSAPTTSFDDSLQQSLAELAEGRLNDNVKTVKVTEIREDNAEPMRVYDPAHPMADAEGYVSYPKISIFREMADMIEASRSYEANLTASKATNEMIQSAMDLLKR